MVMSARARLIKELQLMLGSGMVDIEADPEHYELAVDMAFDRYRQRSSTAIQESYVFLDIQPEVVEYSLPREVEEVTNIFRRGIGNVGGGAGIDPFNLAFTNNLYMLNGSSAGMGGGGPGFLATYDLAMGYQEMAGRMFGRELLFTWDAVNKKLVLERRFGAVETILLQVYNHRPDSDILADRMARPWIRDYSYARLKYILGEARSKFSQIAGPQGGFTLNGEAMKQEGRADMDRLDAELQGLIDSRSGGYGFTIG